MRQITDPYNEELITRTETSLGGNAHALSQPPFLGRILRIAEFKSENARARTRCRDRFAPTPSFLNGIHRGNFDGRLPESNRGLNGDPGH